MRLKLIRSLAASFSLIWVFGISPISAETLKIATWNIEHLGSSGRGFGGGFGGGDIPLRTDDQLKQIGQFIKDELQADILAIQEVSITHISNGVSRSVQLDKIIEELGSSWEYSLPAVETIPDSGQMFVGYLWDTSKATLTKASVMKVENIELAGKDLFDRSPYFGYFEALNNGNPTNDFVLFATV